jgi:MFS family permease
VTVASYWHLLRGNRNLRLLWTAQIVSELGDWFYSVAIFSFLLELTGSAQMVALAFLMQVLPQVFTAPTAGVINDRISRRKVMIFADCARAGIVLSMILVRTRAMLPLLYVLLFLETVCWALFEPGSRAVIPNITKDDEIPVANALSSATWSVNFALGAGLGGLVLVTFGRETVFVVDSLSFVASALLIRAMKFAEPHADNLPPLRARDLMDFSPIAEGIRYVRRDRKLLATIFVKAGVGLAGSNWVILPVLGERVFRVQMNGMSAAKAGALGMSILLASRGAGAILGSFLGGNFAGTNRGRLRWTILAGFAMIGAGYVALGAAGSLLFAVFDADRGAHRRIGLLDRFHHFDATADRGPVPGTGILSRVCVLYVDAGDFELHRGTRGRLGNRRARGRGGYRRGDAGADRRMAGRGARVAGIENRLKPVPPDPSWWHGL